MSNLTDIKNRMKAVADTKKITGAMETVSIAKMSKAAQKCEQYTAYFGKLQEVMSDIALRTGEWVHPCFENRGNKNIAFLVISSSKGLVGGFNHSLFEFSIKKFGECDNVSVFTIGDTAKAYFKKKSISIVRHFDEICGEPTISAAEKIADYFLNLFMDDKIDEINIIYSSFNANGGIKQESMRLLPLYRLGGKERYLYEIFYEPSPEEVLEGLIPQYLTGVIYGCLLQSEVAEHFSRRSAMSVATKNADELLSGLKTEYNRARQEEVTGEITDIITAVYGVCDEKNYT